MAEFKKISIKATGSERQICRRLFLGFYVAVGFVLLQLLLAGCATTNKSPQRELTPITDSPSGIYQPGKFVWNDLLTDDAIAAKAFYGQLFGWTFEEHVGYTLVKNDGQRIGGIAQIEEDSSKVGVSRWLCALSVDDVDLAADVVTKSGGVVNVGPVDMENRGRGAIARDPQGAQLLLIHALGGDPEDSDPAMGSWLWHELWSNDSEASLAFYQKLSGFDFLGEKNDYLILLKDDNWRAGIRYIDDSELEMRWVPAVRVADTEDIAMRAKTLGGKVVVEPRPTESGSVALLSDPSGALMIIQRWSAQPLEQEE
ncbi:MAG: VOC family protein [Desulfuromusa sp.]|nr:VOC family protein [Desulfuromusa sp.]